MGEVGFSRPFQSAGSPWEAKAGSSPCVLHLQASPRGRPWVSRKHGDSPLTALVVAKFIPCCKGRAAGLFIAARGLWLLSEGNWQETPL